MDHLPSWVSLALLLSFASPAAAQIGVPISAPVFVNSNRNQNNNCGGEATPSVATDGTGTWIAVWASKDYGCPGQGTIYPDIVFSRSTDGGQTWSDLEILHPESPKFDVWPQVRFGQGAFVVVWESLAEYGIGGNNQDTDLFFVRSADGGLTWSAPAPVNTDAAGDGTGVFPPQLADDKDPRIATDGFGHWIVVWSGYWNYSEPDQRDIEIQFSISSDNAATWSPPAAIDAGFLGDGWRHDHYPRLAFGAGRWIVAWLRQDDIAPGYPNGGTSDLLIATSDDHGATWRGPEVLHDVAWEWLPDVTTDGAGRWLVAWNETSDSTTYDATYEPRLSMSTDNGRTWSAPAPPPVPGLAPGELPRHHHDGLGTWFAIWPTPAGAADRDLRISRSDTGRGAWTAPQAFNTNAANDGSTDDVLPDLATDTNGRTVGVWSSGNDIRAAGFTLYPIEVVDPNPHLLVDGAVTDDPDKLGGFDGRRVDGLAADGATRVLLRYLAPGAGSVEFSVADELGGATDVGTLEPPGGGAAATTINVPVEQIVGPGYTAWMAFAVLLAPPSFARDATDHARGAHDPRLLEVSATFQPGSPNASTLTRTIELHRPPVLLLHGLWSNAQTWAWPLADDPRFSPYALSWDYEWANDRRFQENRTQTKLGIANVVRRMRGEGFAATRADVFGHSMGGLLARKYVADGSGLYLRPNNFHAGDVHLLVSVDTPHLGSPWADRIVDASRDSNLARGLLQLSKWTGFCATCGAVCDLQTDSAETLGLPAAQVPAHAFVGTGGSDVLDLGLVDSLPRWFRSTWAFLEYHGWTPEAVFGPGVRHDLLVDRASQEGRLAAGSTPAPACGSETTTAFGLLDAAEVTLGVHTSQTGDALVGACAVSLLNTPVDQSWSFASSGFPAAPGGQGPADACAGAPAAPTAPAGRASTGGLEIVDPPAGASVAPGAALTVTVQPTGGFEPVSVLVGGGDDAVRLDGPPWTATLVIAEESIGSIVLGAQGYDAAGELAVSSEVQVQVVVTANLLDLTIEPDPLYLDADAGTHGLRALGRYADGITRDVTASALGTTWSASDLGVAVVDAEGRVTARDLGEVTVTASHATRSASVRVVVDDVPLRLDAERDALSWNATAGAVAWDVVRGDLSLLHATGGDFATATTVCLAHDWLTTTLVEAEAPGPGAGFWYLVRAQNLAGWGSFDEPGLGQTAPRDAAIAASPAACP